MALPMQAVDALPATSSSYLPSHASQHTQVSLENLDEIVLIHILSWMENPQPLGSTCSTLHRCSASSICRQLWFQRWYLKHPVGSHRPLVLAALSWRGLTASSAASGALPQENGTSALVALLTSTLRYLRDEQQLPSTQQQQKAYQLPTLASGQDLPRAAYSPEQHLQLIQQLSPWPEHLLIPAAAAAGNHHHLLQQLLAFQGPSNSPCSTRRAACSSSSTSTSACSSSSRNGLSGAERLQRWLWDPPARPGSDPRGVRAALGGPVRWGGLCPALGDSPVFAACSHNILPNSLVAAAKGGSVECLQLIMHSMVDCQLGAWHCILGITAATEMAAAAGHLHCLELLWQIQRQPRPCNSAQQQVDALAGGLQHLQLQQGQQQQQQGPQLKVSPQLLRETSKYLLVAAASSGSVQVLEAVMHNVQRSTQRQQLPAALATAGQRGHVAALRVLLQHPDLSAKPLQLAASDAAVHGWPLTTLLPLLETLASGHSQELVPLLCRPLVQALQHQQQAVAGAMLRVLREDAELDKADQLWEALLLLAYQGQADYVLWIIQVAPTVLVKVGPRAAAAALEGGHPHLAQLILDRGAERPAAFKAAAKRGQLTSAVAAADATAVRELLQEVSLPLVWACEAVAVGGQSGAVAGHNWGAAQAGDAVLARRVTQPTQCLLTLLTSAALSPAADSVEVLQLLLGRLPSGEGQSSERQQVLLALAKACFAAGRSEQLMAVVEAAGRPHIGQRRLFFRELTLQLMLPRRVTQSSAQSPPQDAQQQLPQDGSRGPSSSSGSSSMSGAVAAALALMDYPTSFDVLSSLLAQSYLAVCMPKDYLGSAARPTEPAAHIPCLQELTQLLLQLAQKDELPPGARSRDLPLLRLMLRTVVQSCDVYLLHAFLLFMQRHGVAVMADMPEDALRALRREADGLQQADGGQEGV